MTWKLHKLQVYCCRYILLSLIAFDKILFITKICCKAPLWILIKQLIWCQERSKLKYFWPGRCWCHILMSYLGVIESAAKPNCITLISSKLVGKRHDNNTIIESVKMKSVLSKWTLITTYPIDLSIPNPYRNWHLWMHWLYFFTILFNPPVAEMCTCSGAVMSILMYLVVVQPILQSLMLIIVLIK